MIIGLVRHFEVDIKEPEENLTSCEYARWRDEYDRCESIVLGNVDFKNLDWNYCYSSDLIRAYKTAAGVFSGEVVKTPLLREVDMRYRENIETRRKIYDWDIYSMINWARNSSLVIETIDDTRKRVNKLISILKENHNERENILLFSHGTIMMVLGEELNKLGYKGNRVIGALNGEIYLYEK